MNHLLMRLMASPLTCLMLAALLVLCSCSAEPSHATDASADLMPWLDLGALDLGALDLGALDQDAADLGAPAVRACQDDATIASCVGGRCDLTRCRGDELCHEATCVPWQIASLSADFSLSPDPEDPSRIIVQVEPGGFPRAQVDALRFDFGDGVAGWAEGLAHRYAQPGVYPVTLEVRLTGHRLLRRRKLAVISVDSNHQPLSLTINQLPQALSGATPLLFTDGRAPSRFAHHVPHDHVDIDVALLDDPRDPVDRASLRLWAERGVEQLDLTPRQAIASVDPAEPFAVTIALRPGDPSVDPLPLGRVTLRLSARTLAGRALERTLDLESIELPRSQDPFNRPMVWLLRDDQDLFTTTRVTLGGDRYELRSTPEPNGQPDFIEELRLLGAQGSDPHLNAIYLGWIRAALNQEIYRLFGIGPDGTPHDGIALKLVWSNEPGAPDPASFDEAGEFSMMRLGGVLDPGVFGYSRYTIRMT